MTEPTDPLDDLAPHPAMPVEAGPPTESDPVSELSDELRDLQDRHLRLAAEYDNYRKRTARERLDERQRAQGDLARTLLEALDDLGRVSAFDPATTSAADLAAGVDLVERKLLKALSERGLERVGVVGEPFDPNLHEAIGSVPATTPEQDQTVAMVFQPGYRLGLQLLRPARVQVYMRMGEG